MAFQSKTEDPINGFSDCASVTTASVAEIANSATKESLFVIIKRLSYEKYPRRQGLWRRDNMGNCPANAIANDLRFSLRRITAAPCRRRFDSDVLERDGAG